MQNHKSPAGARALIDANCSHTTGHYNDRQRVLDLVQPVCAPTGTDHCRATPESTPLALLVIVVLAGTSDCAAIASDFLSLAKFDSWARPAGCRIGQVRGQQKWLVGVRVGPRCNKIDRQTIRLVATRADLNPRVAWPGSFCACARSSSLEQLHLLTFSLPWPTPACPT